MRAFFRANEIAKGSRENKFTILDVEAPGGKTRKQWNSRHISSFRNAAGWNESASKMLSYF
ncbi:MAG TPA: hypothetical protein EYP36_12020 [Calditrichaeota bacterium]|nr:hypothetical protein [Calditrichota bacterium]